MSPRETNVSVLKYFEAALFEAEIIRLIPQWDENDSAIERYYTFLAYSKKGVFADIELSESRKYERLYRIEQRLIAELDSTLDRPDFNGLYTRFESAYLHTNCTSSAMPEYLHVFGFPMNIMPDELTARIVTLKPQLEILEHPPAPRVVLEEDAERRRADVFHAAAARAPQPEDRVCLCRRARAEQLARRARAGAACHAGRAR